MASQLPSSDSSNQTDIYDYYLKICWPLQECGDCLSTTHAPCGWCAASGACVPNTAHIPILAPLLDKNVCPRRDERFELRARPLGCNVSTITFLASVVSMLAIMGVIVLAFAVVYLERMIRRRGKGTLSCWQSIWSRPRRAKLVVNGAEERPLLGAETDQLEDG